MKNVILVLSILMSISSYGSEVNCYKLARELSSQDMPEINRTITEHMNDKKRFSLETDIARFKRILKIYNVKRSKKINKWLNDSQWEASLRNGKIPSFKNFPKNTKISKAFIKEYFKSALTSHGHSYDDVFNKVVKRERKLLFMTFHQGEEEERAFKIKLKSDPDLYDGLNLVSVFEHYHGPEIAKAVRIKNAVKRERAYEKLFEKKLKKIKKAFKLAKKIVRWDNLTLEMKRVELPDELAIDPVLHNSVSRPREGVIRDRLDDGIDFTEDAFGLSLVDIYRNENPRDIFPKSASFKFKKLPKDITVDGNYKDEPFSFLGGVSYEVDIEMIKDRAVYVVDDASNFWYRYETFIDDYINNDNHSNYKYYLGKFAISNHIKPVTDLSNLFEHVFTNLIDNPKKIRMPDNLTIEVMIFGELKYQRDFRLMSFIP